MRVAELIAVAAAGTCLLAACSSSGSGSSGGSSGATTASAVAAATAAVGSSSAAPISGAALASKMQAGAASLRSAHVILTTTAPGQTVTAQGSERFASGKLTALDLTERLGAGPSRLSIGMRLAGNSIYIKLPPQAGLPPGKPWVNLSTAGSDPTLSQLASSVESSIANASVDGYTAFAHTATDVKDLGPATVNGVSTTKYSFVVNVSKLPSTQLASKILTQAGVSQVPVDLWLDGQGRTVQVTESSTVGEKRTSATVVYDKFNQPVSIVAPPADQIAS
jgi:hypothetical protein